MVSHCSCTDINLSQIFLACNVNSNNLFTCFSICMFATIWTYPWFKQAIRKAIYSSDISLKGPSPLKIWSAEATAASLFIASSTSAIPPSVFPCRFIDSLSSVVPTEMALHGGKITKWQKAFQGPDKARHMPYLLAKRQFRLDYICKLYRSTSLVHHASVRDVLFEQWSLGRRLGLDDEG